MAWYELHKKADSLTKREYLQVTEQRQYITAKTRDLQAVFTNGILPGKQYRLVTEKNFSALVALEYFLEKYAVCEMHLAIYRMNYPAVLRLKEIAASGLPLNIIVSSFFRENKKYEKWTRELELFAKTADNVRLSFAWSHAKIFLCKTQTGEHFVFEGSGNLSDNARIEQYLVEDSREMFDFHKNWMNEIHRGTKGNDH